MRGAFSRGRTARYAYYDCHNPDCQTPRKSYPAAAVHREFSEFLARRSLAAHVVDATINAVKKAHLDNQAAAKHIAARRHATIERLKRQMNELVLMRSEQLITDDDFVAHRDSLRRQMNELRADDFENRVRPLTSEEENEFRAWMADLNALWHNLPPRERHGFATLVFGNGYVFQDLRTADRALLFRTFGPSEGRLSNVVHLSVDKANQLIGEIRAFLAIVSGKDRAVDEAG